MTEFASADTLRERLLASELASARDTFERGGLAGVLEQAAECLAERIARDENLAAVCDGIETLAWDARRQRIEDYLRRSSADKKALAQDLRALRRGRGQLLDAATLRQRAVRQALSLESRCEACLIVARLQCERPVSEAEVEQILSLAATPGRWSRQVEALSLLRKAARRGLPAKLQSVATSTLDALSRAEAPRWVQPAALDAMVYVDPARAMDLARERLTVDRGGDDFIVRSRIVELCALHRKRGWATLLPAVRTDPSELVRLGLARVEGDGEVLESLAGSDDSHRVRAQALITLRKRFGSEAEPALRRASVDDAHGFVVETAARELVFLYGTRRPNGSLAHGELARAALLKAAQRDELPARVRAICLELLLELEVLTSAARDVHTRLTAEATRTPPGSSRRVHDPQLETADPKDVAKSLAVLTRDGFGVGLEPAAGGVLLFRGERTRFSIWRLLFELTHPRSSKRQAYRHLMVRRTRGTLRAQPFGMAEVSATGIPGERVMSSELGEWGRYLPRVEDFLDLELLRDVPMQVASARGVTVVRSPPTLKGRLWARWALIRNYAELAELRERALSSSEPHVRASFAREVEQRTGIAMRLVPHEHLEPMADSLAQQFSAEPERSSQSLQVLGLASVSGWSDPDAASAPARDLWHDFLRYALSSGGNTLSHLTAFSAALLGALVVRGVLIRRGIDHDRRAIPLVIGGWGTRGKSGTERLKAALFQGLGYECLVKTTGCEAMFIHALPGAPAHEIFIYRPYDKATVWEQRDVLALARKLNVRVFLWECMALQPDLVNLLQSQWMRDDFSTITNTYPDHEDLQGPTGFDVATTISEFVPERGRLLTAEEQMLPLLREKSAQRGTRLSAVTTRDSELISDQLLQRFDHSEHVRNVALVVRLARSLGVNPTVALVEMADNVVPDVGVLKTYRSLTLDGRTLTFTNGMGANDRAGTLANWERSGFANHSCRAKPNRWLVTVVNNRADRLARSEVFAKLLVGDVRAHRHVLIGTNLSGLTTFIDRALMEHLSVSSLTRDLTGSPTQRKELVLARVTRAWRRLMLEDLSAEGALREAGLGTRLDLAPRLTPALEASDAFERYATALPIVERAIAKFVDPRSRLFVAEAVARRRIARNVLRSAQSLIGTEPEQVDAYFRAAYRELFMASIVAVKNARITGDALIETIASEIPPGIDASLLGMQNIKGTGLGFVYRWLSLDRILGLLTDLETATVAGRTEVLNKILLYDDYTTLDARVALEGVTACRDRDAEGAHLPYQAVIDRLSALLQKRAKEVSTKRSSLLGRLRSFFANTLDFFDSILRRRAVSKIMGRLGAGQIADADAAKAMRGVITRGKTHT